MYSMCHFTLPCLVISVVGIMREQSLQVVTNACMCFKSVLIISKRKHSAASGTGPAVHGATHSANFIVVELESCRSGVSVETANLGKAFSLGLILSVLYYCTAK